LELISPKSGHIYRDLVIRFLGHRE